MAAQPDKKKPKSVGERTKDFAKLALIIGGLAVGAEVLAGL